jgi:DNA-binding response OmpR family regulator
MKRVLVVDDNRDILDVLNIILEMEGFDVKCCDDGNLVPKVVYDYDPDIILLDIMLNGIDGRELCRDLKSTGETSHIPIIMISASHTLFSGDTKECDAEDFIAKPFEINELVSKVEKYIN